MLRRTLALAATAALAVGVASCGKDDGSATASTDRATSTSATGPADAVIVRAVDYEFKDLPDTVDAGARFVLKNESTAELHELVALRIRDDETRSVDELLALPEAEFQAVFAEPPAAVIVAPPGESSFAALGDVTVPDPGRYLFMCFIPTGADPGAYLDALKAAPGEPPQVPGGPPHFLSGMYKEVIVR